MIGEVSGVCILESIPANIICGYTTKNFPVFLSGASDLNDKKIQEKFKSAMLPIFKGKFAFLNQVHGDKVIVLDETLIPPKEEFSYFMEADAIITNQKEVLIMAMTADCLSVFFVAGDWIGVAHAGWRGTKLGILEKTLHILCERSGISPEHVEIHFGPCIRKPYYEVGAEFMEYFPDSTDVQSGKYYFDLALENKKRLIGSGVSYQQIHDKEICTNQWNDNLFSYRLEKQRAGRMVSFVSFAPLDPS